MSDHSPGDGGAEDRAGSLDHDHGNRPGARTAETDDSGRSAADAEGSATHNEGDAFDPAAAFSLLGNEIRLEIVTTLHREESPDPVPFSVLRSRLGLTDSGQFNYHLSELSPHFVSKSEDGYELTAAGTRIGRAIAAGMYTDRPEVTPFSIDGDCHNCGTDSLMAAYRDERLQITCDTCDTLVLGILVPPSVVRNRDHASLIDAFDQWSRIQVGHAWEGLCPNCGGTVEWALFEDPPEHLAFDVLPSFRCTVCEMSRSTSFGAIAHKLPAVRSFHERHGDHIDERPYWEVPCIIDTTPTIISEDPWRIQTTCTAGDHACHVVFDEHVDVVHTEIVDRSA